MDVICCPECGLDIGYTIVKRVHKGTGEVRYYRWCHNRECVIALRVHPQDINKEV